MKKLSKVLTLILALAMVLGLMTVGASAAYTDDTQVQYDEAVALLSGLGVINGIANGDGTYQFNPKGTFDRGGLAKMVAYFCWGGADKSNLYKNANIFTDLAGYEWAAGSINFGFNAGYINGIDSKTYDPDGAVTGSMLAKTLLGVMGYKSNAEDPAYALTGGNWELNSIRLAEQEGLFANLKVGFDPTANLTREEAAQIFYNVLQKNVVYTSYNKDNTPITAGGTVGTVIGSATSKYFPNWSAGLDNSTDVYGRPAKAYTNTHVTPTKVVKVVAAPAKTYMSFGMADKAALTAAGYTFNGTSFVVNGGAIPGVSDIDDFAGRAYTGNVIELYVENPAQPLNITKVVMVQEYLTKVTNVVSRYTGANVGSNSISMEVYNPWVGGDVVPVTFNDDPSVPSTIYDALVAKYAKGDYLMTAWAWGDVVADDYHWIAASDVTTETAKLTASKLDGDYSGTIVAGGKTYTMASGYAEASGIGGALTLGKDYVLYLDANGYVVGAALPAGAAASTNYLYVLDVDQQVATSYGNASTTVKVKAMLANGTMGEYAVALEAVTPANIEAINARTGADVAEGDVVVAGTKTLVYDASESTKTVAKTNLDAGTFGYVLNADGTVTLQLLAAASSSMTVGGVYTDAVNGTAATATVNGETLFVANTVYVVYNATTGAVASYTGSAVAGVYTSLNVADSVITATSATAGSASVVFVENSNSQLIAAGATTNYVYVDASSKTSVLAADGKTTIFSFDAYDATGAKVAVTSANAANIADGLYVVKTDGSIQDIAPVDLTTADDRFVGDNDAIVEAGMLKIDASTYYNMGTVVDLTAAKTGVSTYETFKVVVVLDLVNGSVVTNNAGVIYVID